MKIGDRVPVATGSFQPGIGGVGINPLVNTQFQYLDVGVNIDITPRVHAGREISLKLSMDVSAVTSYQNIGGISQPVIGQRKIENELRLKDGEVSLLGGMMEDTRTKSLTGIPGLAQIPILKYLFGETDTDHAENEIVFVLVPHIIRGPDVPHGDLDMIDVGTANALELRRSSSKPAMVAPVPSAASQGAPAAAPAAQMPTAQGQAAPSVTPQSQVAPNPVAQNQSPKAAGTFLFDPATLSQAKGSTFTVNVLLTGGQNVYSVPVQLSYDPNQLQVVNVSNGGFLSQDGQAVALVHRDDPADRHAANHGHTAAGGWRRFGTRCGGNAHLYGQGAGPVGIDHHAGRSTGSGNAADCDERSASRDYDSVALMTQSTRR